MRFFKNSKSFSTSKVTSRCRRTSHTRVNSLFPGLIDESSRNAKIYGTNDIPPHQPSLQNKFRIPQDSFGGSEVIYCERWSVLLTPTPTLGDWTCIHWSKIVHLATQSLICSPRKGVCNSINELQTWRPGYIRLARNEIHIETIPIAGRKGTEVRTSRPANRNRVKCSMFQAQTKARRVLAVSLSSG
jgi:hypothetical protein